MKLSIMRIWALAQAAVVMILSLGSDAVPTNITICVNTVGSASVPGTSFTAAYIEFATGLNFNNANAECVARSGSLARISSREEFDFIVNDVIQKDGNSVGAFWIGLEDLHTDTSLGTSSERFTFLDGSTLGLADFVHVSNGEIPWKTGRPSAKTTRCARWAADRTTHLSEGWEDQQCSATQFNALCRIEGCDYVPTRSPTNNPTNRPINAPTKNPSAAPTVKPTKSPTHKPTNAPTHKPTNAPTHKPTNAPTHKPTNAPTHKPTNAPTVKPTKSPKLSPTKSPTYKPTKSPSPAPTESLTAGFEPTESPTTNVPGSGNGQADSDESSGFTMQALVGTIVAIIVLVLVVLILLYVLFRSPTYGAMILSKKKILEAEVVDEGLLLSPAHAVMLMQHSARAFDPTNEVTPDTKLDFEARENNSNIRITTANASVATSAPGVRIPERDGSVTNLNGLLESL